MGLTHFTKYNPNLFSWNRTLDQHSIARLQTIDKTSALNREKKKEIGRSTDDGVVGFKKTSPSVSISLAQLEHGSMDIYQALANKDATDLDLDDFSDSACDLVAYLTDQNDVFLGSKWYSNLRLSGFGINIGDPDAEIERSFDLVGEKDKILQGDNKYFHWNSVELDTADLDSIDSHIISVGSPDAVENPDDVGKYILQVIRVRSNVATKLEYGTGTNQFTYTHGATKELEVRDCAVDDIIKYAYSATTVGTQTLMTLNNSDPAVISADSAEVYLYIPNSSHPDSTDYVYRLQSVSLDVTFDRLDTKEIGNKDVVQRAIRTKTVTIGLGRFSISNVVEEILRGESTGYGLIDVEQFADDSKLVIKIYEDNTKAVFKYGFKATGLSPTELAHTMAVDEFKDVSNTLEGESLAITSVEANLLDA